MFSLLVMLFTEFIFFQNSKSYQQVDTIFLPESR